MIADDVIFLLIVFLSLSVIVASPSFWNEREGIEYFVANYSLPLKLSCCVQKAPNDEKLNLHWLVVFVILQRPKKKYFSLHPLLTTNWCLFSLWLLHPHFCLPWLLLNWDGRESLNRNDFFFLWETFNTTNQLLFKFKFIVIQLELKRNEKALMSFKAFFFKHQNEMRFVRIHL